MPSVHQFRSLRFRLLGPMIAAAILAAVVVAIGSSWLGARWATEDSQTRFSGIKGTLTGSTFPLTATVLSSLADLTQTELVTCSDSGELLQSTIELTASDRTTLRSQIDAVSTQLTDHSAAILPIGSERYRGYAFSTLNGPIRSDRVHTVVVLFDERLMESSRRRAAILPLATGLSTIAALTSITLLMTSRLVRRLETLQYRVEAVAAGDFESTVFDDVSDEVGRLGGVVDSMAGQLSQLWKTINRQQSEKLLHQIAGGMAHQLRNSLTGARMAIELHAAECANGDDEGILIAIHQIELSEDYVRRLLLVASGRQDNDHPMEVSTCWHDVQLGLSPIAKHLLIDVQWVIDEKISGHRVKDGPRWVAAVTNLVHNAMQAGNEVQIEASLLEEHQVRVTVADNGHGVPESIATELFEPFVTSKPEGMGLGLSLVRRAAEYLGGSVTWQRQAGKTAFEFVVEVHKINDEDANN